MPSTKHPPGPGALPSPGLPVPPRGPGPPPTPSLLGPLVSGPLAGPSPPY